MERGRGMVAFVLKVLPGNIAALPAPLKVQKPSREPDVIFCGSSHMRLSGFHPSGMPGLGNVVRCCAKPRPCVAICQAVPCCKGLRGGKHRQGAATRPHASRCWPPYPAILFLLGKRPPPRRGCLSRCPKESKLDRMACPLRLQMTSNEGRDRCGCAAGLQRLAFPIVRGCRVGRSVGRRNCLRCAMARGHRRDLSLIHI